ncbi:hypothetical protein Esti_003396 [Eimeria stiedai]
MKALGDEGAAQSSERYDRQLRIWGEGGQACLRNASVLILGCGATAAEALRNLVLPGVGRFALIDDARVQVSELSEHFLLSPDAVGDFKSRVICSRAVELNPAVYGEAWAISPHRYLAEHARPRDECSDVLCETPHFAFPNGREQRDERCPPPISNFDLVIAPVMPLKDEQELLRICSEYGMKISSSVESSVESLRSSPQNSRGGSLQATRQVPVVSIGSVGFFGWVRLWAGEYCLVNTKPENPQVDLRLANPFPELLEFAWSFDMESMDDEQHSHVPFVVVLIQQAVCRYRGLTRSDATAEGVRGKFAFPLPDDAREKIRALVVKMQRSEQETNFFEALDNVYRTLKPASLSANITEIMERASKMPEPPSSFWRLARALHKFYEKERALPVCPLAMDMTADTSSYVALQRVYAEKVAKDEQQLMQLLLEDELTGTMRSRTAASRSPASANAISGEELQSFCRNATHLKVVKYPEAYDNLLGTASLRLLVAAVEQMNLASSPDSTPGDDDDCGRHHIPWYVTAVACKIAADKLGRFPGAVTAAKSHAAEQQGLTTDELVNEHKQSLTTDIEAVAAEVRKIEEKIGLGCFVPDDVIKQVVQYRGSEFPTTAALIGGVTAQEAIKLLCKQFEPVNNTFLWNGTERRGAPSNCSPQPKQFRNHFLRHVLIVDDHVVGHDASRQTPEDPQKTAGAHEIAKLS